MGLEIPVFEISQMFAGDDVGRFVLTLTSFDEHQDDDNDDEETEAYGGN